VYSPRAHNQLHFELWDQGTLRGIPPPCHRGFWLIARIKKRKLIDFIPLRRYFSSCLEQQPVTGLGNRRRENDLKVARPRGAKKTTMCGDETLGARFVCATAASCTGASLTAFPQLRFNVIRPFGNIQQKSFFLSCWSMTCSVCGRWEIFIHLFVYWVSRYRVWLFIRCLYLSVNLRGCTFYESL